MQMTILLGPSSLGRRPCLWLALLVISLAACLSAAQGASPPTPGPVRPAKVFGSHMVLQHGRPINVWGEGPPGEKVTISLGTDSRSTRVDSSGRWTAQLPARPPSDQPVTLAVNATIFDDVLVGDVWLCSGQSNMAYSLKLTPKGRADRTGSANPLVRVAHHTTPRIVAADGYSPKELARCNPHDFFACRWLTDADVGIEEAAAVAWYFGHKLQPTLGIPIGLVVVAVGGSALNNWIPAAELRQFTGTASLFTDDWLNHPDVKPPHRTRAQGAFQHVLEPGKPYLVGRMPYRWMCEPAFLFEAGIEPLGPLGLSGVIWYQGESDAASERTVALAKSLLPMLVQTWRANFRAPKLPWLFVQLPAHEPSQWPAFRELQRQVTATSGHASLAVTIDLGTKNNVHPVDKKPVGDRLALLALRHVYNRVDVTLFPEVKKVERLADRVSLKMADCPGGLRPVDGPIAGFEAASADGVFQPAPARLIAPDVVEITTPDTTTAQIRYLWSGFPEPRPQLFNREGLPLGPFVLPLAPATNEPR